MPLNQNENLIVEAFKSFLADNDNLGVPETTDEAVAERGSHHMHQQIDELFAQKAASLVHFESVRGAFNKIHSFRYLEDARFVTAFESELKSRAVPVAEVAKACKYLEAVKEELAAENAHGGSEEQDAGFHPDLDEVMGESKTSRGAILEYGDLPPGGPTSPHHSRIPQGPSVANYNIAYEEGYEAGYKTTSRNEYPRVVPLEFVSNQDSELHDAWLTGYDAGRKDYSQDCAD